MKKESFSRKLKRWQREQAELVAACNGRETRADLEHLVHRSYRCRWAVVKYDPEFARWQLQMQWREQANDPLFVTLRRIEAKYGRAS